MFKGQFTSIHSSLDFNSKVLIWALSVNVYLYQGVVLYQPCMFPAGENSGFYGCP